MRIALLADIHGNIDAMEKVLEFLDGQSIDQYACVGDVVGYGASPRLCLERIRSITSLVVAGNHDHAAVGLTPVDHFNRDAKRAVLWTSQQLEEEDKKFLKELPLMVDTEFGTLVHATPDAPGRWHYIYTDLDALLCFEVFKTQICFTGHSHIPIIFASGDPVSYTTRPRVKLSKEKKYLVNVGSVGQPRDGDCRSCVVIYDDEERIIETHRISYDIEKSQSRILSAGLPDSLAIRLALGQ